MDQEILFPGDTLGIIGGNPNGIMLARAAKKMGFTVVRSEEHTSELQSPR